PIDVNHSGWHCRWEHGAVRLGMKFVKGLRASAAQAIEEAAPFVSADDLARRATLRGDQLTKLAYAGALSSLGLRRRASLWQAAQAAKPAGELFERRSDSPVRPGGLENPPYVSPLDEM